MNWKSGDECMHPEVLCPISSGVLLCGLSLIVSLSVPQLALPAKSLSASAAPAASDSVLPQQGGTVSGPKHMKTHKAGGKKKTEKHLGSVSLDRKVGCLLRMTTTEEVALNGVFKSSSYAHVSINPLTSLKRHEKRLWIKKKSQKKRLKEAV